MEIHQINPNIRYAREHNNFKGASSFSKCYDCRIFYVLSGKGYVTANGEKYPFAENYIMFFPPRTEYRFTIESHVPACVQVFNFDLIDRYFKDTEHLGTPSKDEFDPGKVREYELPAEFGQIIVREDFFKLNHALNDCIETFISKQKYYKEIASTILKRSLLILLIEGNSLGKNNRLISAVLAYINENYANTMLTNETIAAHFNYHPYYLNKLIKNFTGKTIHQYIISYRLRMAKDMLLTTDDDVNTIAWKVGFNSASHFINTFHRRFGRTPYEYRQTKAGY